MGDFQQLHPAMPAVRFDAWRVSPDNPRHEARPIGQVCAGTLADARDTACGLACFNKGDTLMILAADYAQRAERRFVLHTWPIRQKPREYRRDPATGRSVPFTPLFAAEKDHFAVAVDEDFAPIEPADVLADRVGRDLSLVEG